MTTTYVVGDPVVLGNTFAVAGTPTDPTTISLTVVKPNGTETVYTYAAAQITRTGTGVYTKQITVDAAGVWRYLWVGTGTAEDVADGAFTVWPVDAASQTYVPLAELKDELRISDTADDAQLRSALTAASRAIDAYCHRRFYAATETRYYTARHGYELAVDDLLSVTTLKTDDDGDRTYETTWATTDYDLEPYNAPAERRPYTHIRTSPNGTKTFSRYSRGVEIVGSFGYATTVPAQVRQACLLQAVRFHKRRDAPFGVAGVGDLGEIRLVSALDPDVRLLLAPFVDFAASIA